MQLVTDHLNSFVNQKVLGQKHHLNSTCHKGHLQVEGASFISITSMDAEQGSYAQIFTKVLLTHIFVWALIAAASVYNISSLHFKTIHGVAKVPS